MIAFSPLQMNVFYILQDGADEEGDEEGAEFVGETDADGNEVRRSSRAKDDKLASERWLLHIISFIIV